MIMIYRRCKGKYYCYLPKMAIVMLLVWCFKPDNSWVTGLRAASASSALFSKAAYWVSQPVLLVLKLCFNCSIFSNVVFGSDFAFEVSDCWVWMLALRSLTWDYFIFSSACNMNKVEGIMTILFLKSQAQYKYFLSTWGLMPLTLFSSQVSMMTRAKW